MKRYRSGQFTLPSKSVVTPLFVVLPHTIAGETKNAHNIGLRCAVHFSQSDREKSQNDGLIPQWHLVGPLAVAGSS